MRNSCVPGVKNALGALLLAATVGPAAAALPPDSIGWSAVYSDFSFELIDLVPTDNLSPQITISENQFAAFFSGELTHIEPNKGIGGFIGPGTEVVLNYKATITIQALNYNDSFASLLYEDLAFVEGGQGYVFAEGFWETVGPAGAPFDGRPVTQSLYIDTAFRLNNGSDPAIPTFARFDISLGETAFQGMNGGPISPIPEPSTYALLLAGLGMVGLSTRRRRSREPAEARSHRPAPKLPRSVPGLGWHAISSGEAAFSGSAADLPLPAQAVR
jgi:hypothetical protein